MDLKRGLRNLFGWRTDRKIVVIESDDWGSIRMSSKQAFEALTQQGVNLSGGDSLRYNLYDSLATADDLELLFETLSGFRDKNRNPCVFTPVTLTSNPDFEKIKASNFQEYYSEPFTETLKRFPGCEGAFKFWKEGIEKKIFVPQSHGREHLCIAAWMRSLRAGDRDTLLAFNQGVWGFGTSSCQNTSASFQAAFDFKDVEELCYHQTVITECLKMFEKIFGYRASLFVPPNGLLNNRLEKDLVAQGIRYISASKIQREPQGQGKVKRRLHWLGQKNAAGLICIVRNCLFEPSLVGKDWVDSCLKDVHVAFQMNKPAIISSHRVNFIGAIDPANRDRGLRQLGSLLESILNKWPSVEFMTSEQLGDLMLKKNEN